MTTFYICRHGQTENNKNDRLSGWIDTPLTDDGIRNALSSANKLDGTSLDAIISSDLGRAFTTAYIIANRLGHSAEIDRVKGLREVNYGDYANALVAEVIASGVDIDNANPTGETLAEMQLRVLESVKTISSEHPNQTILLVAHDGTINALRAHFDERDISAGAAVTANPNDFVATFMYDNGSIISFDEVLA